MKNRCDEIVAALATGGAIRRWQARRHAARCPQCAGIPDQLQRATEALADVAPLTTVQRGLWIAAAGDEGPTAPTWARWFRPALTGLLAAAIAGGAGGRRWGYAVGSQEANIP